MSFPLPIRETLVEAKRVCTGAFAPVFSCRGGFVTVCCPCPVLGLSCSSMLVRHTVTHKIISDSLSCRPESMAERVDACLSLGSMGFCLDANEMSQGSGGEIRMTPRPGSPGCFVTRHSPTRDKCPHERELLRGRLLDWASALA